MDPRSPAALRQRIQSKSTTPAKPASPPKPPTVASPEVKFQCGHSRPLAKIASGNCPACKEAKRQAKSDERKAKRPARKLADGGRLPDGSRFDVTYYADATKWIGKLIVLVDGGEVVYEEEASGVFHLLRLLDSAYRSKLVVAEQAANLPLATVSV